MVQSIVGTNLAANWAASAQTLSRKVEIKWDGVNWIDETAYVLSINTRGGISSTGVNGMPMFAGGAPASGSLTLSNDTGRFSRRNVAGALYANIQYGLERIPIKVKQGYVDATNGAEILTRFTGYIYTAVETESGGARAVTLELRGMENEILQRKQSTGLHQNETLDTLIATLLTAAGISSVALDKCLIPIPYSWLDDENTWEECQRLAQAEMALFWVNELGVFTLRRLSSLVERSSCTTSQLTLSRGSATWLEARTVNMISYSKVTVEIAGRIVGPLDVLYQSQEAIEVPASGSKIVTAAYTWPCLSSLDPVKNTDWYAVTAGVQDISGSITVTRPAEDCQRCTIQFDNANGQNAFIYALQVRGYPLICQESSDESVDADATTLTNYWRSAVADAKELRIAGNHYIQTHQQASMLAAMACDWTKIPRTLISWKGPGAPWLQPTDRVTVTDAKSGINEDGYILDIADANGATNYEQALLILPCADLFPHVGYFIIGTSLYKDSASAYCFY